jgi:hypothetical protein
MPTTQDQPARKDHIDTSHDYAVCAWARHFNVSQQRVKEAVRAVGSEAERVREHLQRAQERPSA